MTQAPLFPGRVGLQQRVLPIYRAAFFDRLAGACAGGLSVFAGEPRPSEAILTVDRLQTARYVAGRNVHLFGGSIYLCLQPDLLGWLEEWNPDALILEANPRYVSSRKAAEWMHRRGRPVIGWGLGAGPLPDPLATFRAAARRRFLSRFDAVIAYSSVGAAQYRALGIPAERVFVAPNAVSPPPGPLAERPPLHGRPARLLFVGRLQARKRVDLLLRACAACGAKPELWIVGDGPVRAELERLAQETYPSAQFRGALQGSPLDDLFTQADLFVLPGTGGLAVQEAMAHGLPVIVAEGDGTQNDLVRAENGWLVPSDNLQALTHTLRQALQAPDRLRLMGAASHRIVAEEVNIDVMVRTFIGVLLSVRSREA